MEDSTKSHQEEITQKAEAMQEAQTGIRSVITELEAKLINLQELNQNIMKEQKRADDLQKEVIGTMARMLTATEEQEKKAADLTLYTLKKISDLIQMGGEE